MADVETDTTSTESEDDNLLLDQMNSVLEAISLCALIGHNALYRDYRIIYRTRVQS